MSTDIKPGQTWARKGLPTEQLHVDLVRPAHVEFKFVGGIKHILPTAEFLDAFELVEDDIKPADNIGGYTVDDRARLLKNAGIFDGANGTVVGLDRDHGWRVWVHPDGAADGWAAYMDPDDLERIFLEREGVTITTPAPLDPSKVAITLKRDDYIEAESDGAKIGGKVSHVNENGFVAIEHLGTFAIHHITPSPLPDGYRMFLLTAHTPAPEPEPEWKPGTVGTAGTVRGLTYTGPVVRTDEHLLPWWTPSRVDGAHYHGEDTVTDFVPDEPRPLPTRDEVAGAIYGAMYGGDWEQASSPAVDIYLQGADSALALLRGEAR